MVAPAAGLPAGQLSSTWGLFRDLLPAASLNDRDPHAPQTVYTPYVVTWLLVFQRLQGNATLNDAVSEFILRFPQQARPDCKRAREQTVSANSGAYSAARSRLDGGVLRWAADHVFDSLVEAYVPSWLGRRVFIVDGSTVQLPATQELRHDFPPASNQHGESHWPILHLAVAHELASGLAVFPQFGAKYGPGAIGEIALARGLLVRLPERSVLLADRNFGIFAFAHAAAQSNHDVVLRLTQRRFRALLKGAERLGEGKWELTWRPSATDRRKHPDLPADAAVTGWLYEARVSGGLTLWLFATTAGTPGQLAELYRRRLDVETDIRDLKQELELDQMRGKSTGMVEKELAAALLAYNLANQVRRLAAARLGMQPRRLSFAGVWSLLKAFLAGVLQNETTAQAEAAFERLLKAAGQRKLPRRAEGRRYPREVIARRRTFPRKKPKPSVPR